MGSAMVPLEVPLDRALLSSNSLPVICRPNRLATTRNPNFD